MLSIAEEVARIVGQRQFLAEGLSRNLFNLSALARELRPEIEKRVKKPVTQGAVLMSLARFSKKMITTVVGQNIRSVFTGITVRSRLMELTYANSAGLLKKQHQLLLEIAGMQNLVCTMSHGVYETTIIVSEEVEKAIRDIFSSERLISSYPNLSSISITLQPQVVEILGAYAWLLNVVAWSGINIVEVVSTYTELVIIVRSEDIDRAFSSLHTALKTTHP